MLYAPDGRQITVEKRVDARRHGMQMDAYDLPEDAYVSFEASKALHNQIKENSRLRELIETADKMTGTKTLHLAMMRRDEMPKDVEDALVKNQKFAEGIMNKRESNGEIERKNK